MTELPPPRVTADEAMPVQLARMEGTLNLVAERIGNLTTTVDGHTRDIAALQLTTQALAQAQAADTAKTVVLREADEVRRRQAESSWSPISKVLALILTLVAVATLVIQLVSK